ncbi:hypothetical protein DOTSEDRAFT_39632 [Dothistroma septosporum NZE10]|uniref:Uncharacterized protein n=1 Tax=Dothistroma septosporum (strain NZE10 / CBS 128990) TaxID=675120 RepID=M2WHL9_DOTSN|nr:hypothetical protein DOTSEDRAFT_39632 [Dothistroma septosporum NZE10]
MQTPPDSDQERATRARLKKQIDEERRARWKARGPKGDSTRSFGPNAKAKAGFSNGTSTAGQQGARVPHRVPTSYRDTGLVLHKPTSTTNRLRSELVFMLERTQRTETWFELVPSRLGHSQSIDAAALAIIKAAEHAKLNTNVTQESCLGSYSKAIITLNDDMGRSASTDDMLITVGLLVTFERMFAWTSVPLRSHMHGIVALLMNSIKVTNRAPSEMIRAVQYTFWPVAFIGPCVMGTPSMFEHPRFLDAEPVLMSQGKLSTPAKTVARARKLSNQLFIRLPRLIMMVKALQTKYSPLEVDTAVDLAKELFENEDIDAENELLHHVQIQKTESELGRDAFPYSMKFHTLGEYEALMHHWSTRMILSRLCWKMSALFPTKYQAEDLPVKKTLETTMSRMAANVLMACHWGLSKGEAGESCLIIDLVSVWGALNDFDLFASRKLDPAKARSLLKQIAHKIMRTAGPNALDECADRLQAASELFSGGKSEGILQFTFSRPPPGQDMS